MKKTVLRMTLNPEEESRLDKSRRETSEI